MRVHLKAWQDKDKGAIQDINTRITGKEMAAVLIDINGIKFNLMESKGKLYIHTADGKPLAIDLAAANSLYVRLQE